MASPREKSPRLYWSPAGRTYRPSGSTVAARGMGGATIPPLGPAAPAARGAQYAPTNAQSDSAVAPASQPETLLRRRRVVPKNAMAMSSFASEDELDSRGEAGRRQNRPYRQSAKQAIAGQSVHLGVTHCPGEDHL